MDLTAATPVEIDTALSEIYGRYYRIQDEVAKYSRWIKEYNESLDKKAEIVAQGNPFGGRYSAYTEEKRDALQVKRDALREQAFLVFEETKPYDAEFRSRPWSRFFLVQNNGGHIHSSMDCSTCNKRGQATRFGWLPNLSGLTEAEAVAAHGAILCTVCYPSAPVEYTDRRDPSVCDGSGLTYADGQPKRVGYYSGNWGTCQGCGTRQTVTKTGAIRKHKKP